MNTTGVDGRLYEDRTANVQAASNSLNTTDVHDRTAGGSRTGGVQDATTAIGSIEDIRTGGISGTNSVGVDSSGISNTIGIDSSGISNTVGIGNTVAVTENILSASTQQRLLNSYDSVFRDVHSVKKPHPIAGLAACGRSEDVGSERRLLDTETVSNNLPRSINYQDVLSERRLLDTESVDTIDRFDGSAYQRFYNAVLSASSSQQSDFPNTTPVVAGDDCVLLQRLSAMFAADKSSQI